MVKKAVVGLSIVVLVAAFGAGIFVGMQTGGAATEPPDDSESPPAEDGGGDTTATSTATSTGNETENETATDTNETSEPEPTPTPTPTEREPYIPPSYYDEATIEQYVAEHINRERQSRNLDPMSNTGTTANELSAMARGHSQNMAKEGQTVHTINGLDSRDRYERAGLDTKCSFQASGASYIREPTDNKFEALGRTTAGTVYTEDGEERLNRDEEEVAQAIVTKMFDSIIYSERLTYENAKRMGVGANVTAEGKVYVTVDVCG